MKKSLNLSQLFNKALIESFQVSTMLVIVDRIYPGYNIHKKTGFPANIPIPPQNVSEQIVNDVIHGKKEMEMANELFKIHESGYMGRRYTVSCLQQIFSEFRNRGYVYDAGSHSFREDARVRKTRNWGVLKEDDEYNITFLKVDIVGNSKLVKKYSSKIIKKTYDDLRFMVTQIVEKRDGRIWYWEGDGGLGAFYSSKQQQTAALSAMEILHELFFYNLKNCPLESPLLIRTAVHSGQLEYSEDNNEIRKTDIFKKISKLESSITAPNTVSISTEIKTMLDSIVSNQFIPMDKKSMDAYKYELKWAK